MMEQGIVLAVFIAVALVYTYIVQSQVRELKFRLDYETKKNEKIGLRVENVLQHDRIVLEHCKEITETIKEVNRNCKKVIEQNEELSRNYNAFSADDGK